MNETKVYQLNLSQARYLGYMISILLDLTVINFADEHWDWVSIPSFTVAFMVTILLQGGLSLCIRAEHKVAAYFKEKQGVGPKVLRGVCTYIILVGGKFVIMGILNLIFGERIEFGGPFHGAISFVVLVALILVADGISKKIYYKLATPPEESDESDK